MYYSESTRGFYDSEIHGDNIPVDAIEITDEEHASLLAGQSAGKRIVANKDGRPVLADPIPPSDEQLAAAARAQRDALLKASDWVGLRAMETGDPVPDEWLKYRQALRDISKQKGFPKTVKWPVSPAGA